MTATKWSDSGPGELEMAMFNRLIKLLRSHFPMSPRVRDATPWEIMDTYGSSRKALLFASLFVPELTEVDGSVFLTKGDPDTLTAMKEGIAKWDGPREELEDLVNMAEVHHLFSDQHVDIEETDLLTEFIAEAWRGRLSLKYPGRAFHVWIEPEETTGDVPVVRFHEVRPKKAPA